MYRQVQQAIDEAAIIAGVSIRSASDIFASGVIIDQVRGAIETADVVVAVRTI